MKKIFYFVLFVVVLVVLWAVASVLIGNKTETVLQQQLQQANTLTATDGIQQELVSYDKSFFGATAVTRLKVDTVGLDVFDEVQFIHRIKNGPVLFHDGVQLAASHWQSELDLSSLDEASRDAVQTAFAGKTPVQIDTVLNLDETADYQGVINPLNWESDAGGVIRLAEATFNGSHDLTVNGGPFALNVTQLELRDSELRLAIPALQAQGSASAQLDQLQGDFNLEASQVSILPAGMTDAISFNVALNSKAEVVGAFLQGDLELAVTEMQQVPRVQTINWKMQYEGINADGMKAVNRLQAKMHNLEQQLLFNQDEQIELPEGQTQGMALLTEIQQVAGELVDTVFNQALQADKSQLIQALTVSGEQGQLQADATLRYAGTDQTMSLDRLMFFEAKDWGALVRGTVNVVADKALLGDEAAVLLGTALAQGGITEADKAYQMALNLLGEQVEINGKTVPFAALPSKFLPQMPALAPREGIDVPDDIMEQIEQQGLTPEIMQQLEESDDVSPETLKLLKQLQQMQSQLK